MDVQNEITLERTSPKVHNVDESWGEKHPMDVKSYPVYYIDKFYLKIKKSACITSTLFMIKGF